MGFTHSEFFVLNSRTQQKVSRVWCKLKDLEVRTYRWLYISVHLLVLWFSSLIFMDCYHAPPHQLHPLAPPIITEPKQGSRCVTHVAALKWKSKYTVVWNMKFKYLTTVIRLWSLMPKCVFVHYWDNIKSCCVCSILPFWIISINIAVI